MAAPHADAPNTISIPFVILSAVLISIGLLSMTFFLITFQFVFLGGIALVLAGGLMLFSPYAGSDHA